MLVTSRNRSAWHGLTRHDLEQMSLADATELLLSIEGRIDGLADRIATLCGRWPLALMLAGAAFLLLSLGHARDAGIHWWMLAPLAVAGVPWVARRGLWRGSVANPLSLGFWLTLTLLVYPIVANLSRLVLE